MIGGYDLIYDSQVPALESRAIIECIVKVLWPSYVVEEDAQKENHPDCFFYKDAAAKASWDKDGSTYTNEAQMIYFLAGHDGNQVTLVLGSTTDSDMQKFLGAVKSFKILGDPRPVFQFVQPEVADVQPIKGQQ